VSLQNTSIHLDWFYECFKALECWVNRF